MEMPFAKALGLAFVVFVVTLPVLGPLAFVAAGATMWWLHDGFDEEAHQQQRREERARRNAAEVAAERRRIAEFDAAQRQRERERAEEEARRPEPDPWAYYFQLWECKHGVEDRKACSYCKNDD